MTPTLRNDWSLGINNQADGRRLPRGGVVAGEQQHGAVRDLVNLDPHSDGTLKLRAGFTRLYQGTAVRGLLALGRQLLLADGSDLVAYSIDTSSAQVIGQIDSAGTFAGAVFNGELFICTATEALRYDGTSLRKWGVTHCGAQPVPTIAQGGGIPAGAYQLAVTFENAHGEEGGTTLPLRFNIDQDGASLALTMPTPPEGGTAHLYVSTAGGDVLYHQAAGTGPLSLSRLADDGARMGTERLREPVSGGQVLAYNGVLLTAVGNVLWSTLPLRPHLRDAARGFIQYADTIGMAIVAGQGSAQGAGSGVFVAADKTYFVTDLEDQASQREVLPYGAVPGTAQRLPDGRVTWMTHYGQVVGTADGQVQLLSADRFAPDLASHGAGGVLERDGNHFIVTTMAGAARDNPLCARDYYRAEITPNDA